MWIWGALPGEDVIAPGDQHVATRSALFRSVMFCLFLDH